MEFAVEFLKSAAWMMYSTLSLKTETMANEISVGSIEARVRKRKKVKESIKIWRVYNFPLIKQANTSKYQKYDPNKRASMK